MQANRYRIAKAPLTGFGPDNAVIYAAGVSSVARLDPAPTERPTSPPRPELGDILRWNLELP